jgi:hypothetical protein
MRADFDYDDEMIAVVQLVQAGGHTSIYLRDLAGVQWGLLAQQCRDMADRLEQRERDGTGGLIRFDLDDAELDRLLGNSG